MSDTYFLLGSIVVIVGSLYLLLKYANDSFLTWYGDSGFTKVEKSFTLSKFGFDDIINGFLIVLAIILFIQSFKLFLNSDIKSFILITVITLMLILIPTLHFFKKYLFFKLNGGKKYTFNPKNKTLKISNEISETIFGENEIEKISDHYINSKIEFSFKIIHLKTSEKIFLSSDLPFTFYITEFFNKNKIENIEFDPNDIFKMLRYIKSFL